MCEQFRAWAARIKSIQNEGDRESEKEHDKLRQVRELEQLCEVLSMLCMEGLFNVFYVTD